MLTRKGCFATMKAQGGEYMGIILLFAAQLGTMIYCFRRKRTVFWIGQFIFQLACTVYAGAMWNYYTTLPVPDGLKAPGLYMFSETVTYWFATMAFICLFVVTLFVLVLRFASRFYSK